MPDSAGLVGDPECYSQGGKTRWNMKTLTIPRCFSGTRVWPTPATAYGDRLLQGPRSRPIFSISSCIFFNRRRRSHVGVMAHISRPAANPACHCSTPISRAICDPHAAIRAMPTSTRWTRSTASLCLLNAPENIDLRNGPQHDVAGPTATASNVKAPRGRAGALTCWENT
jgi:hypothetical protein